MKNKENCVLKGGGFANYLEIEFDYGDKMQCAPSSIFAWEGSLDFSSKTSGGFAGSIKRTLLGGQSLFMTHVTAKAKSKVCIAPVENTNCITMLELNGVLNLRFGTLLAAIGDIEISGEFNKIGGFMAQGGNISSVRVEGYGTVALSAPAECISVNISPNLPPINIDTGNIYGFSDDIDFSFSKLGSVFTALMSREVIFCEPRGSGAVIVCSRKRQQTQNKS